jgi:hypothetical protein
MKPLLISICFLHLFVSCLALEPFHAGCLFSRISVIAMTGAVIAIDDTSAADTILSVKQRVFAANRKLHVRQQRLVYRPGPRGINPLADDETLGGAGVAQDGTAELDVLLVDLTQAEAAELGPKVLLALCPQFSESASICAPYFDPCVSRFLCHSFVGETQLLNAAQFGRLSEMAELLDEGANIQYRDVVRRSFLRNFHVQYRSI